MIEFRRVKFKRCRRIYEYDDVLHFVNDFRSIVTERQNEKGVEDARANEEMMKNIMRGGYTQLIEIHFEDVLNCVYCMLWY